ncbi:MAG: ROK family transcriptional regulator [Oscillospiraceae bacterium]
MDQHGISKLDLKRQNRMQVLKILKQRGPTSRIDIATTLELTRAAVTIITNEMIEQGIIVEIGEYKHVTEKAPRGRKKILIDINHNYKFALGVCIEEDIASVGLSTLSGAVLDKRNLTVTDKTQYRDIYEFVKLSASEVLSDNCLNRAHLLGVGFAVIPTMYERLGVKMTQSGPDYTKLRAAVGEFTKLPVVFDNSVKGTAMANIDFQKTKDPNRHNIAFLQFGNTLNFVVTNLNDPIISYDNRTDFVDKMIINPFSTILDENGRRGTAKSELSPAGILGMVRDFYSAENTPYLFKRTNGNPALIDISLISDAYQKGDRMLDHCMEYKAELFAVLINNLYFSTNPQKIVLHNFMRDAQELESVFREKIKSIAGETVSSKIDGSIIEEKNRFLSGCALAIRELFFTRGGFGTHDFTAK